MTEKNEITAQLFKENEIKTNKVAAMVIHLLGTAFVIVALLDMVGWYSLGADFCKWVMLSSGIVAICAYPISKRVDFEKKWVKDVLLGAILVTGSLSFFLYPLNADFITYGPIIIAAMYFDRKLIKRTVVISWFLYSLLLWLNVWLDKIDPEIWGYHKILMIDLFSMPYEVLVSYQIPHTVLFVLVALLCDGITKRGIDLLTKQATMTRDAAVLESDLEAASKIQLTTMPKGSYKTPNGNIDISAFIRPAKAVGGDFYDYFLLEDKLVFLVADVSDKGLPAAMFMMKAKNAIRLAMSECEDFETAINKANEMICLDNSEDMFVTVWIGCINIHTGVGKFVNCGHLLPVLIHEDGTLERIENEPDLMLGVFDTIRYRVHELRLNKGDNLIIFTDGLTDAINKAKEQFGEQRLIENIVNVSQGKQNVNENIVQVIDSFAEGARQYDDMTSLRLYVSSVDEPIIKNIAIQATEEATEKIIDEVNRCLEEKNCPEDERRKLDVVLDEICENIVEHAYEDTAGTIEVRVCAGDNYIEMEFIDNGEEFNPVAEEDEEIDEITVGGMGIHLYRNLMDRVEYKREDNENHLIVGKIWNM